MTGCYCSPDGVSSVAAAAASLAAAAIDAASLADAAPVDNDAALADQRHHT